MLAKLSSPSDRFNARSAAERWRTHCDPTLVFEDERLAALLAIWREAGQGTLEGTLEGALPRREDFTARMLGKQLQHLTFVEIVEDISGRRYRFRLFGTALSRFTGDWTGKLLDEAVPEPMLTSWLATYDTAVEARAPLRYTSRFRAAELAHIAAETLIAPLADAGANGSGGGGGVGGLLVSVAYTAVVA